MGYNIFEYEFMRKAFVVGILLAIILSSIGVIIVFKRLSMIGDSLSHVSLAGVAFGLVIGINPILGAVISSIIAALVIEVIRKRIPEYAEMSLAIVLSAGVGLAGVLSGFVKTSVGFHQFLFGSLALISDFELVMVIVASIMVLLLFVLLHKQLFFLVLDERTARLAGVPVKRVNYIFTILMAITVSLASRTVGTLMVASLMVIPVACAMQFGQSFKQTIIYSMLFSVFFTVIGFLISYYVPVIYENLSRKGGHFSLKPGGTIVLTGVLTLAIILLFRKRKS